MSLFPAGFAGTLGGTVLYFQRMGQKLHLNFKRWLLFEKLKSLMHETSHDDNIMPKSLDYIL